VLVGSAFQLFLILWFGHLSDRYGRRPVYLARAVGAEVWVFVFFPAPIVSIALLKRFDSALPVSLYVLGGLIITIVSVWLAPETARVDLHEEQAADRRMVQDPRRLRPT
jgi:MFS family permease